MPYRLEFEIHGCGLPKTTNQLFTMHHFARKKERDKWKRLVMGKVLLSRQREPQSGPLKKAKVTLVRYSSGTCDADNLAGSFKSCMDGLKAMGVIEDDSMKVIGTPEWRHEKAPPGKGYIKIIVESVDEP